MSGRRRGKKRSASRRVAAKAATVLAVLYVALAIFSVWFVHHPKSWVDRHRDALPRFVSAPVMWTGSLVGDITDGLGFTGHDAVYEYDEEAPSGSVLFAGAPERTGAPAPDDVVILDRGEFVVGWSPSLGHPLWCAYHVTKDAKFADGKRPDFSRDRKAENCPNASAYAKSGYDRGHMVPNHAIVSRYGTESQKKTFLMSNVAPQSPSLNRKVWRDMEHRIADLWTARYGEIWVIVGAMPSASGETIPDTAIDIPDGFYQVVVAQEGLDIRALAVAFERTPPWSEWAARNIISIDNLEKLTGLDFLAELPDFIQDPLEAELPSRLWPVRKADIFKQILLRFK